MLKLLPTLGAIVVSVSLFCSPARAQNAAGAPSPNPSPQTADWKAEQPTDASSSQATDQPPAAVGKVRSFIENNPIVQRLSLIHISEPTRH